MTPSRDLARLIEIMAALRTPGTGCAWDLAQSFESIVPYTIEETYEVADAVERGDREDLRDELGDLLLQVVFQARIAEEEGSFDFGSVVEAITTKLIRRHPHIFGDRRDLTADEVKRQWNEVKDAEKAERTRREARHGPRGSGQHLAGVQAGLPALLRSTKLQVRAAEVGFDWNDPRLVLAKIREEADEAEAALGDPPALADEIGDLMFAVVNLARHAGVDPETALRAANRKFERRFGHVERELQRRGASLEAASLDEMERLWQDAKVSEVPSTGKQRR
ncbi:MAG TPA: nucleoside triphosphate pyrophosphohydrolase [Lichenihabitans sp.]|jgi:ATP diphosphatase|nr:nucleoside triphosphate pyrophosphohydrolase [Lichenihabitans sp.]